MNENENSRLHAFIKGGVQGVGFRYFTLRTALDCNLTGWVRNRWDGRVEVLAEGGLDDLNRLLTAVRKGPGSAEVRDVRYEFTEAKGEFDRFQVLSNA
ncbi:MAG: acylphosphatase [Anaerolineales bacterium]